MVWALMAFHLFNISIDTPDHLSFTNNKVSIRNDQESFTELILEKLCGFEDLVPEASDTEGDEHNMKKSFSLDNYIIPQLENHILPQLNFELNKTLINSLLIISSKFTSIISPPPEG